MRFAGSWLVSLPWISILASWQKCEKSNPGPDFLKMAPVCEDLTKCHIHALLNAPLTLIYIQCLCRFYFPKHRATWGRANHDFSIIAPHCTPTGSAQIEPLRAHLPHLPDPVHSMHFNLQWDLQPWNIQETQAGDTDVPTPPKPTEVITRGTYRSRKT